MTDNYQSF